MSNHCGAGCPLEQGKLPNHHQLLPAEAEGSGNPRIPEYPELKGPTRIMESGSWPCTAPGRESASSQLHRAKHRCFPFPSIQVIQTQLCIPQTLSHHLEKRPLSCSTELEAVEESWRVRLDINPLSSSSWRASDGAPKAIPAPWLGPRPGWAGNKILSSVQ